MQCTIQQKHSDRIGAKPKAPNKTKFTPINPNGLRPIRSLLLCIPLHSSASRTSVAFHSQLPGLPEHFSAVSAGVCTVQCPAPGRQLTWGHGHRFHQMWPSVPLLVSAYVSSSSSTSRYHHSRHAHFHSCYCTQDLHLNLATIQLIDSIQYTTIVEEQKKTTPTAYAFHFQFMYEVCCQSKIGC